MTYGDPGDESSYDANSYEREKNETPMAKMHREQAAQDAKMGRAIHELHDSLPAHSSDLDLFTFAEIKQWGLKHTRKRAK